MWCVFSRYRQHSVERRSPSEVFTGASPSPPRSRAPHYYPADLTRAGVDRSRNQRPTRRRCRPAVAGGLSAGGRGGAGETGARGPRDRQVSVYRRRRAPAAPGSAAPGDARDQRRSNRAASTSGRCILPETDKEVKAKLCHTA